MFSKLDGLTPFLAPLSPAPVQETGRRSGAHGSIVTGTPLAGGIGQGLLDTSFISGHL